MKFAKMNANFKKQIFLDTENLPVTFRTSRNVSHYDVIGDGDRDVVGSQGAHVTLGISVSE